MSKSRLNELKTDKLLAVTLSGSDRFINKLAFKKIVSISVLKKLAFLVLHYSHSI